MYMCYIFKQGSPGGRGLWGKVAGYNNNNTHILLYLNHVSLMTIFKKLIDILRIIEVGFVFYE